MKKMLIILVCVSIIIGFIILKKSASDIAVDIKSKQTHVETLIDKLK